MTWKSTAAAMFEIPERPLWWRDAACAETGLLDDWFPDNKLTRRNLNAIAVCQTCPVRGECLLYAREHHIREGIWGGIPLGRGGYNSRRRARRAADALQRFHQPDHCEERERT